MKSIYFGFGFVVLCALFLGALGLVISGENKELRLKNEKFLDQVNSYKLLDAMQNVPMPAYGDAGRFLPDKNLFYVKTFMSVKEQCLASLHEIGHGKQWSNNDSCYYDSNLFACEPGAEQYEKQNAWRCEGLK